MTDFVLILALALIIVLVVLMCLAAVKGVLEEAEAKRESTPVSAASERVQESERVVVKEVVLIPCEYCGKLMPQADTVCSNCGATRHD